MSLWKKLFGKSNKNNFDSQLKEYKKELDALDLKTLSDLENLVKPLIKVSTKLEVLSSSKPPENSQLKSHFGGQPYFEKEESWPKSKAGKHLDFIFQVFNTPDLQLPDSIALIQFYYDWDEFPWDTSDDGWLVKTYKTIDKEKIKTIEKPSELEKSKYCEIDFKTVKSLPDWEGLDVYCNKALKLACVLDEDESWDLYDQIVTKLTGIDDQYQSQLGGFPRWVQGEATPDNSKRNPTKLLFQIDSEDNADIMWGDAGLIYVFYDEETEDIEFTLQCH